MPYLNGKQELIKICIRICNGLPGHILVDVRQRPICVAKSPPLAMPMNTTPQKGGVLLLQKITTSLNQYNYFKSSVPVNLDRNLLRGNVTNLFLCKPVFQI